MNKFVLFFIAIMINMSAIASDLEKEKRWEEQIVDSLMDGEAIHIETKESQFLGIEMSGDSDNTIGIITIHGIGVHPNWEQVIQPVRIGLAESGFYTLSIQMPILANEASADDYNGLMPESASRIDLAIQYLKKQGINKIVLVAHSLGTQMSSYYLSGRQGDVDKSVIGFVGVSMLETAPDDLRRITLPVLDIYGSNDNPQSIKSVPNRQKASSNNKNYKQVMVTGADHFFDNKEAQLLDEINQFISGIN